MAGDVKDLGRFVTDVLGDLSVDDERNEWLRETLREFLARNRSYVATADAMTLHRNTIQYRVTQAMELCGQSFDDPDAVFRVQTYRDIRDRQVLECLIDDLQRRFPPRDEAIPPISRRVRPAVR
jgi:DNA-binding PucR family transcriptional regulator